MIGYLQGVPVSQPGASGVCTYLCGDVGYEVFTNELEAPAGFWIHEHAPQDAPHELYGFATLNERDLFRRLLDIKGVGPKVAMRIVGSGFGSTAEFRYSESLTKIRGVGATLAARIVEAFQ